MPSRLLNAPTTAEGGKARRLRMFGLTLLGLVVALTLVQPSWADSKPRLVVYTYDSFVSWGPAESLAEGFAQEYDAEIVWVAPSSAGEMLSRLVAEMDAGGTQADVFLGLSDTQLPLALRYDLFLPLDVSRIPHLADVPPSLHVDPEHRVIPYDHGYVALVYDREALQEDQLPTSLEDLTSPRFARQVIAIDPRTSSVGHAFLLWTIAEYGEEDYLDYWNRLEPSLLTIAGGWSAAYSMFEEGEAPIVVSYTTDTAYSVFAGNGPRYGVITPGGQAYQQVELAGIVKTSQQVELAHAFLNYLLSPEIQSLIPTTNWMFPANARTPLPQVFQDYAVQPARPVRLSPQQVDQHNARWLRDWAAQIIR